MLIKYTRPFSSKELECIYDFVVFKGDYINTISLLIDKFHKSELNSTIISIEAKIEDYK